MIPELRTFLAVARLGTFAAAGDVMGLTQSAVSGQMKRLEDKLGHELFERTGRAATLNETGLRVFEKAQKLLSLAETLTDPDDPSTTEGTLKIGAVASAHIYPIPEVLPRFASEFPKMRQTVVPGISLELLDKVDSRSLDLAIIIKPNFELPATLQWTMLEAEPFVMVAPRSWNVENPSLALRTMPFVRYSRISFGGRQVESYLNMHQIRPKDFVELDDICTILSLVADECGIAIVPRMAIYASQFRATNVIELDDMQLSREIGIIHPRLLSDPANRFVALCIKVQSSKISFP
ncbi:LysR substrate-binding domain-containing protein [Sulfitobacter sp. M13]